MLQTIKGKKTNWEGLWWHPENMNYSSASINLSELQKYKGSVRLIVKKNRYYKQNEHKPNYIFMLMDSNYVEGSCVDVSDIENKERLYTYDEVKKAIHLANTDGVNGYTDIMVEDYLI